MKIYTIYWNQKPISEFIYTTFLSLVPSLLNPETLFEQTPWGPLEMNEEYMNTEDIIISKAKYK